MPGYDWALLADRGGEAIESLIATLLILRHPTARQINPSQGDGGIDILLETPEGIEVWQVKKFTSPLDSHQWGQVRGSWNRFGRERERIDAVVARYHLVTPWTPTRERYADFQGLTESADFPAQWDGEAYINGLADEHPATMDRFVHGPGAFERFVAERAMLAQSPIERAAEATMLQSIEVRQSALDDLRDSVSDNYWIDYGTRTHTTADEPPLPDSTDPAVFHRMTYLGDNRWRTQSLVPRSEEAARADPIHLEVTFLVEEGSADHKAVREWEDWGIPFADIPARTVTHGGPFNGDTHDDSFLSFMQPEDALPPLFWVVRDSAGSTRLRTRLTVLSRTQGTKTGWLRLLAETPMRALQFELRVKDDEVKFNGTVGDVEGLDPAEVLDEIDQLTGIEASETFSIETENQQKLVAGSGMAAPSALTEFYRPIALGLKQLQRDTTQTLVMPDIEGVTMGQVRSLERYVTIYGGTPAEWTSEEPSLTIPTDPAEAEEFLRDHLPAMINGTMKPYVVEQPIVRLADREYLIERPLVTSRRSFRIDPELDVLGLNPGDRLTLESGGDDTMVTAAVTDWTPGSFVFPDDDESHRAEAGA